MRVSRHQFEAYLDKVFDFSHQVAELPEGRRSPLHSWKKVFDAVFLGAACQFPNLDQIEAECRSWTSQTAALTPALEGPVPVA
jgi:hypothetical protein